MNAEAKSFEQALAQLVTNKVTGGLEAKGGRKRWQFFFDSGRLVCTRSNLKSEQDAAIKAEMGDLPKDELAQAQAARRIRNACGTTDLTWKLHTGAEPPHRRPVDTAPALVAGLAQARDKAALLRALGPLAEGWPRVVGDIASLGLTPQQTAVLQSLDGSLSLEQALAQAPSKREALAAIWLAAEADMLTDGGAPPDAEAVDDMDMALDIDALIAEEVGGPEGQDAPTPLPQPQLKRSNPVQAPPDADPREVRLRELDRQIFGADNYFQMFELPWNAPAEKFRLKYMDFARELHPDRYNDSPDNVREMATELFDRIREAWDVLSKEAERQKYTDRVIHGKKSEEEVAMEKVQNYWSAESEFKRGLAAFNNGRTVEAHGFFKAAVEFCPEELEFLLYYGYTLFYTSRVKDPHMAAEGIKLIQQVLKQNEKQDRKLGHGWILLGRAWREQGDLREALRTFKHAVEMNPGSKEARRYYHRTREQIDNAETSSGFLSRVFGKNKR